MNTPVRSATPSFSAFAEGLAATGFAPANELAQEVAAAQDDVDSLAQRVVERGWLTEFQLSAVREGRASALRVGNYDLIDRLGAGGMGTVFKARHRRMKRIVALKVLAASLSSNELFVKRFQREVETIAILGHPNVVMAYDADEAEVGHFLVMEFVSGLDLAAWVSRSGPLSVPLAVHCTLEAARGLAYAHAQGIVHRDIKPHNLLCDENGTVKVTDLGLARLNPGSEGAAAGAEVTMAGGVIGTADYMPPEQAVDSTTIDHRADIYSLGCTLHYLLTGKPPYRGSTIIALLLQHRDGEIPSLCAARSDVPPRLDALFKKMLAKSVSRRVQQMSEVVEELEAIADSLAQEEPSSHVAVENAAMTMDSPGGFSLPPEAVGTDSLGFDVTLAPDVAPQLAAPSKSPAGKEASAKPCTVLVVEPSRVQASIIKKYLIEHSLDVVGTAATGKDAVAAVRSLQPRAVVSALHLSDVSGVELAKQIRDEIKVDAPGFVLVTSEADDPDSQSLSRLNRVLMLPKPFTSAQLFEAINLVGGASQPLRPVLGKKASAASSGKKPKSAARVLIVDDSGVARKKIRSVLQQLGFAEFLEATDGAYAIAVAAQEACDLIVTDYNMPLMDGRALVSYLKQNPATSAIPIVMVTTETEPSVLDPVRKLGVLAVIEKAFPAEVVAPLLDPLFAG